MNTYQKGVVSPGLLELPELTRAQLIQLPGRHIALSIISACGTAGDCVPWAAARDICSRRCVFAGPHIPWPTASCESKAADASLPWCRAVPGQLANTLALRGGFSNLTERLFHTPGACSCSQSPCKLLPQAWCFYLMLGNTALVTQIVFLPFCSFLCICTGPGFKFFICRNICPMKSLHWQGLSRNTYAEKIFSPANSN